MKAGNVAVLWLLFGYNQQAVRQAERFMTIIDTVLGLLLLTTGGLAVAERVRYVRLKQKHKALQQRFEKAEQQLLELWGNKKS